MTIRASIPMGIAIMAAGFTAGCTGFNLQSLAPPGIIRYERIADEKEPNPAIQQEINDYRAETQPRFPKVGETAAGGAKPRAIPDDGVEAAIDALAEARTDLEMGLEADLAAASEDRSAADGLSQAGEDLSDDVDRQKSAAAREKREAEQAGRNQARREDAQLGQ